VTRPGTISKVLRTAGLPALWAATALAMRADWRRDPFDPARYGTERYGHNHEAALVHGLWLSLIELAVVILLLRPWSYRRSWGRALAALAALVPWTLFWAVSLMHQGGIVAIHFLWLVALVVVAAVSAGWSGWAAWRDRPAVDGGPAGASAAAAIARPFWHFYVYRGVLYAPTTARLDTGALLDVEPVLSAPADDPAAAERVIAETIRRGNPARPHPARFPRPVLLAHTKARSWSEIDRNARGFAIEERGGAHTIIPYRRAAPRGWEEDLAHALTLAPGLSPEDVAREAVRREVLRT
jgi:hypothetical protein